ncbi:hypothetical protein [Mycobacterium gordonae]|uniref:hypothetical protein n=1 Tax=Mycobacterium gordonae TaxID=1778 RepID=UPI001151EAF4|nr:hypothetical protein [Mycobacterium gordonae]MCV7010359.1 hypothetical protein [Mycobacterium gordonae]
MTAHKPAQNAAARARVFLRDELTPGGPARPSADLRAAAEAAGIAWRNVERQRAALGVVSEQRRTDAGRQTVWSRPAEPATSPAERVAPRLPGAAPAERIAPTVRKGQLGQAAKYVLNHPQPRPRGTHQ